MMMMLMILILIIRKITPTAIINDNDNVTSPACVCCPGESSGPSLASPSLDRVSLGLAG